MKMCLKQIKKAASSVFLEDISLEEKRSEKIFKVVIFH